MTKQKRQNLKPLLFCWDTAPDERSGFTEVEFPDFPLFYLNYLELPFDPANRVLWWIDKSGRNKDDTDEVHEEVVMAFARDIKTAQRAVEAAFIRLLKPPVFSVVT